MKGHSIRLLLTSILAGAAAAATSLPAAPRQSPAPGAASTGGRPGGHEVVILAHGMGRTRFSMASLATALEHEGFEIVNYGYPSRSDSIARLAQGLASRVQKEEARPEVTSVHLVGHSLGNILIRWVIANRRPAKLGRIVMLAPPNRGSHRADLAAPWFSWLSAPLPELTTWDTSTVNTIPTPADVPIGIIAGSHDGTVPVTQTFLEAPCLCDHVVVPSGHTFIMRHQLVHRLTTDYLKSGSFFD
ncbi:MAG: esterase/lipase family protein [Candidatus Polarisedimenticolia bacterium]